MDTDERREILQEFKRKSWEDDLREKHRSGELCTWVSSFRNDAPCCLGDSYPYHGSYNAGLKLVFEDRTTWLLRFPMPGPTHDSYTDEKVAMEVAAIRLIRENSTIPVPTIHAWGIAAENPLCLGPFIIMDFIQDGVSLNKLLRDPESGTRLLRNDLSDGEMEILYRQVANFLLQLFKLDFDYIGNLASPHPELRFPERPLTWKAHEILQNGGVNTFGNTRFPSTADYFRHVFEQDLEHLRKQENSVFGPFNAKKQFRLFKVLRSLAPNYVNSAYNTKFKIICDDLGLANLIVKSREDLTVIGVVDLEWSYVGPAQLFGSAPWWLLMCRPTDQLWDCHAQGSKEVIERYFRYLEIFKRVLEEEEARMEGCDKKELSKLVHWSEESGAMWIHMLLTDGFNHRKSFPFSRLIQHVGETKWEQLEEEIDQQEIEDFSTEKTKQLEKYERELEIVQKDTALFHKGKIIKEAFIATHSHFLVEKL